MKNNVLVDGNYLLYRTVSAYKNKVGEDTIGAALEGETDQDVFFSMLKKNYHYMLGCIRNFGQSVVVFDSRKKWRLDFYPEYKANRKKDKENEDFTNFLKVKDYFENWLEEEGVIVSRVEYMEGDDLIFAWQDFFKSRGLRTVIISGDKDFCQLLDEKTAVWCNNSYNNVLYCCDDELVDVVNVKTQAKYIDPKRILFEKILGGDAKDNVKKPQAGLGEKRLSKLYELVEPFYEDKQNWLSIDFYEQVALRLGEVVKVSNESLLEHIANNVTLVWLDWSVYDGKMKKLLLKELENKKKFVTS
jgi:5'-3' exonuclease